MSRKLPEEELERRFQIVKSELERNPNLAMNHFTVAYGYQAPFLKDCAARGLVFGKGNTSHYRRYPV